MERVAVMRTFSGSLSQPPICDLSFTQKSNHRDASFSLYLRPDEETNRANHEHLLCTIEDSELSIFDAQKYFDEPSDSKLVSTRISPITEHSDSPFSSAPSADGSRRNYRSRSFHATPTASSEASWNSHTGLLSHPPGAIHVSLQTPQIDHKKRGWLFWRKCCSDEKSVEVQDKKSEPKTPTVHSAKNMNTKMQNSKPESVEITATKTQRFVQENRIQPNQLAQRTLPSLTTAFSFPVLKPSPCSSTPHPLDDPPRDSLEVFQPPSETPIPRKSTEIQRLIERQNFTFSTSPNPGITSITAEDDIASDASSDLFEIESFSTQTTIYPMYRRRDSLDEASNFNFNPRRLSTEDRTYLCLDDEPKTPSIAPTECYAPSEVSIDWSVTTAEGLDRGSVTNFSVTASEFEDFAHMKRYEEERNSGSGGGSGGKLRGNGLLSCRCEKAVNVGPQPVKFVADSGGGRAVAGGAVNRKPLVAKKPTVVKSRAARLSLAFAT